MGRFGKEFYVEVVLGGFLLCAALGFLFLIHFYIDTRKYFYRGRRVE